MKKVRDYTIRVNRLIVLATVAILATLAIGCLLIGAKAAFFGLAAVFSIISGIRIFIVLLYRKGSEFKIFLCDEDGFPGNDLAIESPDGPIRADKHGKIVAKPTWNYQEITIHEAKNWRLLDTQIIIRRRNERIVKIVVKNYNRTEKNK